jgi:hypothetical protein
MTMTLLKNDAVNAYEGMPLTRLQHSLESVQEEIAALEKVLAQIESAIANRVEPAVKEARDELQKYEGTVRVCVEDVEVKHTVAKRVEWDTKKLDQIAAGLEDASHWIDFKLSISEKKYDAMPPVLRSQCDAARTIKHGKPKIELTIV